jgi:uncharacterized metal-binding protein YceD (DUF177 family)
MKRPPTMTPEFSRPLPADSIGRQPVRRHIQADGMEREKLARRFDLASLDRLEASLELSRHKGDVIRMKGHLTADAVQSCVVTLAPVPAHLEIDFETSYSASAPEPSEAELDPLGEDAPEPIPGGEIDLGEAATQQFAIALDPYPRAPGARLDSVGLEEEGSETGKKGPFAALAALRGRS